MRKSGPLSITAPSRGSSVPILLVALLCASAISGTALSAAAPGVQETSSRQEEPDPDALHSTWNALLEEHVRDGRVNYEGLLKDRERLQQYLTAMAATGPAQFAEYSDAAKQAFWINAYNAWTVDLILGNWPVDGIKEIVPLWRRATGASVFRKKFIPLGALTRTSTERRLISLDDIEHGILRTEWKEPRIHFALVCASKSCPALRSEAWTATRLEEQLDSAARSFLSDPSKNRFNARAGRLELSSIFRWFRPDFERDTTLVEFVTPFLPKETRAKLAELDTPANVVFLNYDWGLNGQPDS